MVDGIETGAETSGAKSAPPAFDPVGGHLDPQAREYLEEQTKLTRLQIEDLRREDRLRHWSLRVRHINDVLKLAFGLGGVFVVLLLAVGLGAFIWDAHEASGLIVQPLDVPPDFATQGLDGKVLAQELLDKLNGLVREADKWSFRSADSISGNWGDDSKVEIPETGVSVFELQRFLRQWLGHQTTMSGELYHTASGVALTVRAGANAGETFNGRTQDIGALLSRAAQSLLAQTQPYRYILLLYAEGHSAKSVLPIARRFANEASDRERPWLLAALETQLEFGGDFREASKICNETIALAPENPSGFMDMSAVQWAIGHMEQALSNIERARHLFMGPVPADFRPAAVPYLLANANSFADDLTGAFGDAIKADIAESRTAQFDFGVSGPGALANDFARDHDLKSALAILAHYRLAKDDALIQPEYVITTGPDLPEFYLYVELGKWTSASRSLLKTDRVALWRGNVDDVRHTLIWPLLAYAWSREGRVKAAETLIGRTPEDCTLCLEMRGKIAEGAGTSNRAAFWFNRAIGNAPSIPFAYDDWGQMLLSRGQYDAAIAKFALANQKGPHFADPLEMWGEALMQKNRSDLALAKFEEANIYAPNWGRLHLKWGQALLYTGDKAGARKQFAIAARLDLTESEKSKLAAISR